MTDITRWLYNRLEQFKTMDRTSDLFLEWIRKNIKVRTYGDIEDPQVEVEWA